MFRVFTIGWEPSHVNYLLTPIEKLTGVNFIHGLVGEASRVELAQKNYPELRFTALSKKVDDPLPAPDLGLLVSLEGQGIPTIRSMIQGDRVLRYRSEEEALAYATLLSQKIRAVLEEHRPDLVLASHDHLHSAISLAVAKSLGIPWVAMTFAVIPDNLTGFCNALTPDSLVPIVRQVDDHIRNTAKLLIHNVRTKNQKVLAYKAPTSFIQWGRQYVHHVRNLIRRRQEGKNMGVDIFTFPSASERMRDIVRRTINRLRLPADKMLKSPPEGRYVYYPFHMAPESMLDTWAPFYQNQLAFVAQLSLAIPVDTTFVVKLHFSDPDNYSRQQLEQLMNMPRVRIAHPNALGSAFIENAALVVGITGTSCLEAALLGKPVLIFGDSPYQHFPRSERAKRPDEWYEQICRMLEQAPPTDDEIVESYAAYMARYMPGRINDWSRPITSDEMERFAACFVALRDYVLDPVSRSSWYAGRPFGSVG